MEHCNIGKQAMRSLSNSPPPRRKLTDEQGLLKAARDSLEVQFGDVGLGSSLLSMQGARRDVCIMLKVQLNCSMMPHILTLLLASIAWRAFQLGHHEAVIVLSVSSLNVSKRRKTPIDMPIIVFWCSCPLGTPLVTSCPLDKRVCLQ